MNKKREREKLKPITQDALERGIDRLEKASYFQVKLSNVFFGFTLEFFRVTPMRVERHKRRLSTTTPFAAFARMATIRMSTRSCTYLHTIFLE